MAPIKFCLSERMNLIHQRVQQIPPPPSNALPHYRSLAMASGLPGLVREKTGAVEISYCRRWM